MRKFTADENELREYNGIVQRIARIRYEYDLAMQQLAEWEQAHGTEIPEKPAAEGPSEDQPTQ